MSYSSSPHPGYFISSSDTSLLFIRKLTFKLSLALGGKPHEGRDCCHAAQGGTWQMTCNYVLSDDSTHMLASKPHLSCRHSCPVLLPTGTQKAIFIKVCRGTRQLQRGGNQAPVLSQFPRDQILPAHPLSFFFRNGSQRREDPVMATWEKHPPQERLLHLTQAPPNVPKIAIPREALGHSLASLER